MFSDYEVSKDELKQIPREVLYIPADIPSVDVNILYEIPDRQVVHTVTLTLKRGNERYVLGGLISAELTIYSSFNWNLAGTKSSSDIECYYDVILDPDIWLISGSKRAQFTIRVYFNWIFTENRTETRKNSKLRWFLSKVGLSRSPRLKLKSWHRISYVRSKMQRGRMSWSYLQDIRLSIKWRYRKILINNHRSDSNLGYLPVASYSCSLDALKV